MDSESPRGEVPSVDDLVWHRSRKRLAERIEHRINDFIEQMAEVDDRFPRLIHRSLPPINQFVDLACERAAQETVANFVDHVMDSMPPR